MITLDSLDIEEAGTILGGRIQINEQKELVQIYVDDGDFGSYYSLVSYKDIEHAIRVLDLSNLDALVHCFKIQMEKDCPPGPTYDAR
jgi:hypothetical protein